MITTAEKTQQNKPAIATVVNFGVSFFHRKDTEKTEKPTEDTIPKTKPVKVFFPVLSIDIIKIPTDAMAIAIQTFEEIFSRATRFVFLAICTRPAIAVLPSGENAH